MAQSSRRTIRWLYVLLALLTVVTGLIVGFVDDTFLTGGVLVPATVVKVEKPSTEERPFDPSDPTPNIDGVRVTYEYEDAAGKKQKGRKPSPILTVEEGDTIQIQYSPDYPRVSEIVLPNPPWRRNAMVGLLVLAFVLLLVGVWGLFRARPDYTPTFSPVELSPDAGAIPSPTAPDPETNPAGSPVAPGLPTDTPPDTIKPGPTNEG